MNKKVVLGIIAVFVISLIGVGIYRQMNKKTEKNVIKIGAILPLTGEFAEYGLNDKKGIDLAIEEFQKKNPEIQISFVYEDNKSTPKDAVSAIKKLCNIDKPLAIIDDAISTITLSILPEAETNGIVLMSTGATNPGLSGKSPYFFRVWNSDIEEGAYAAKTTINQLKKKSVSVIFLNTDYGIGLKDAYIKNFIDLGGKVIETFPFDQNDKDYKNLAAKVDRKNSELIYLIGYANQTGLITKTLRTNGYKNLILSTVATEDKKFIELAGKTSENVLYVYNAGVDNASYKHFKSLYKLKYNEDNKILTDVKS